MKFKALLMAAAVLVAGCGVSGDEDPAGGTNYVIKVEERVVTEEELANVLSSAYGDSATIEQRTQAIVSKLLLLEDAVSRGLDRTDEYLEFSHRTTRGILSAEWLSNELENTVTVDPDTVDQVYAMLGNTVIYTALTVSDSAQAHELRQLVETGEDMRELAAEFSTRSYERALGGVTGPVDMVETYTPDIPVLQQLSTGELSRVYGTPRGFRFIRLDSSYTDSVPPLPRIREHLYNRILARARNIRTAELQDSLAAAGEVVIHDDGVALVAAAVSSSAPSGSDLEEDYGIAVATFQAGTVTARDLIGDIRFLSLDTRTPSPDPVWVRELALHTAVEEIMTIAALSMGMDTVSVTSSVLQRRLEDHLLDMYYACVIQPHLEAGESDLEELYLQVKDTLIIPEKRVFRTVTARGFDQMAFMQRALEADEDIFTMTDSLTQDPTLLAPGESCLTDTMVWSDVPAPWDSILFEAELDETVFCSVSVDRVLAFQPVAITAARPAMFRESLDELQEIYRTMKEDQLLQGLVDSLASVYHIEIDRDFVNSYVNTGGANDLQN